MDRWNNNPFMIIYGGLESIRARAEDPPPQVCVMVWCNWDPRRPDYMYMVYAPPLHWALLFRRLTVSLLSMAMLRARYSEQGPPDWSLGGYQDTSESKGEGILESTHVALLSSSGWRWVEHSPQEWLPKTNSLITFQPWIRNSSKTCYSLLSCVCGSANTSPRVILTLPWMCHSVKTWFFLTMMVSLEKNKSFTTYCSPSYQLNPSEFVFLSCDCRKSIIQQVWCVISMIWSRLAREGLEKEDCPSTDTRNVIRRK